MFRSLCVLAPITLVSAWSNQTIRESYISKWWKEYDDECGGSSLNVPKGLIPISISSCFYNPLSHYRAHLTGIAADSGPVGDCGQIHLIASTDKNDDGVLASFGFPFQNISSTFACDDFGKCSNCPSLGDIENTESSCGGLSYDYDFATKFNDETKPLESACTVNRCGLLDGIENSTLCVLKASVNKDSWPQEIETYLQDHKKLSGSMLQMLPRDHTTSDTHSTTTDTHRKKLRKNKHAKSEKGKNNKKTTKSKITKSTKNRKRNRHAGKKNKAANGKHKTSKTEKL